MNTDPGDIRLEQVQISTSELKTAVGRAYIDELALDMGLGRPIRVGYALGMRAEESTARAKKPILERHRMTAATRRIVDTWLPIHHLTEKQVYLPFLELQRRVADASGVQLVFWTGIGDLGAVTAFPRIAAMHKRPSTTRPGRAYVRSDPNTSFTGDQVVDVVTSVRHEP